MAAVIIINILISKCFIFFNYCGIDLMLNKIKDYLFGVREEMRQVSWLNKDELTKSSVIVIVISGLIAIYLGLLDFIFNKALFKFIIQ